MDDIMQSIFENKTMKKLLLILTAVFLVTTVIWLSQSSEKYRFDKIADNVYVIHGPLDEPNPENRGFMNNPGLIVGSIQILSGIICACDKNLRCSM
jgi:hypothetical protein